MCGGGGEGGGGAEEWGMGGEGPDKEGGGGGGGQVWAGEARPDGMRVRGSGEVRSWGKGSVKVGSVTRGTGMACFRASGWIEGPTRCGWRRLQPFEAEMRVGERFGR